MYCILYNPGYIASFYIKLRDITFFGGKTVGFANYDPNFRIEKDQNYGFRKTCVAKKIYRKRPTILLSADFSPSA